MARTKKDAVTAIKHNFSKPTVRDLEVIKYPRITEKSMSLMQDQNKVSIVVCEDANKTEIKLAFQRIFQVKVTDVKILNVKAKETTRGTRYKGTLSGFKKAVVSVADGEAIDLFKD